MSETEKELKKEESGVATVDFEAQLDSSDILEFLMTELQEPSSPDDDLSSDADEQDQDTARVHEYVLPASALKEPRTLEELADMATGSYQYEPPEEDATDSPEDYFHHTRKLKALRMD